MILFCRKCSKPMYYKYRGPLKMTMTAIIMCGTCSLIELEKRRNEPI